MEPGGRFSAVTMFSKYAGTCKRCGGRFNAGATIEWTRGGGAMHADPATCAGIIADRTTAAPTVTLDASAVVAFLAMARERGLKAPKVHFLHVPTVEADGAVQEVTLSLAKDTGRNPGAVYVKLDGEYVGKIAADGTVGGSYDAAERSLTKNEGLRATIAAIVADPAKAAKAYAALRGRCSFCSLKLTDAGSVEVGYGPVCAAKYGLPHKPMGTNPAQTIEAA